MRIYANVDLDKLEDNITTMESLRNREVPILAVIKSNAYGHGAVALSKVLENNPHVCGFAVATAEEAMELRDAGIKKMILVLGFVFPKDYERLILEDVRFCVFRLDLAMEINEAARNLGKKAKIHIKLDTGMGRIGFVPSKDAEEEILKISQLDYVEIEGIFTHFARADESDKSFTLKQFDKFKNMVDALEKRGISFAIKHCANSAVTMSMPELGMDMLRAGITLYGLCPSEEEGPQYPLKPILSLYSHIVHLKTIQPGDTVSYGGTYVAEEERLVATVPVGYADGYPRSLSSIGSVLIRGQRAPIIGRVCMDQFMVDVTDISDVSLLDQVTLIGTDGDEKITMEEIGELSGRFNYELACDLGNRIPRFFYHKGKKIGKLDFFA